MKTTEQWLHEVKTVPGKLDQWLIRQYIGEALAAQRISSLAESQIGTRNFKLLMKIANDEVKHTEWIGKLLTDRGIPLPDITTDGVRYWEPILGNLHSFEEIAGAGHHAEAMRLVRISALAKDMDIDEDIRNVFILILPEEQFHTAAFAKLSTPEAIEKTRTLHEAGLEVLGLVI